MEKKKNVTIPEELFIDLVKYFLADIRWDEDRIRSRLQEKLEAMVKRELYTRYKTAGTPEEREKARQEYLEKVGIPENFSWHEIVCTAK